MKAYIKDLLCCSNDKSSLTYGKNKLVCQQCKRSYNIVDGIIKVLPDLSPDIKLSIEKWDSFYKAQLDNHSYEKEYKKYMEVHFDKTYKQINDVKKIKDITYMEIGAGPSFFAREIAHKCKLVVCIDFCPSALKISKKMFEKKKITNYLLIQADILKLPIKSSTIDLIYGGGVIEHFDDTQTCVNELYRALKKGGASFNTVPYLNIGSLTYRQVWGNIPNVPVLKQIAQFIHIKILGGKHMIFGYEMSFLKSTLINVHKKAGFKEIKVDKLDVNFFFEFIPQQFRKPFIWLASNSSLFWPMIKVVAVK